MSASTKPIKNVLIVESKNDKAFVEAVLRSLDVDAQTEALEIEDLHKFLNKSGKERRGKTAISEKLDLLRRDLDGRFSSLEKLGILLNFDSGQWTEKTNLELVNSAIKNAFGEQPVFFSAESQVHDFKTFLTRADEEKSFQAACFFTKDSSGKGNLDSLLFEIRQAEKVPKADCLSEWKTCVEKNGEQVSHSEFVKNGVFWYLKSKAKKLDKSIVSDFETRQHELFERFGDQIFDFNHSSMKGLRDFLLLFKDQTTAP